MKRWGALAFGLILLAGATGCERGGAGGPVPEPAARPIDASQIEHDLEFVGVTYESKKGVVKSLVTGNNARVVGQPTITTRSVAGETTAEVVATVDFPLDAVTKRGEMVLTYKRDAVGWLFQSAKSKGEVDGGDFAFADVPKP